MEPALRNSGFESILKDMFGSALVCICAICKRKRSKAWSESYVTIFATLNALPQGTVFLSTMILLLVDTSIIISIAASK